MTYELFKMLIFVGFMTVFFATLGIMTVLLAFESRTYFLELITRSIYILKKHYYKLMMRDKIGEKDLASCWQEPNEDVTQMIAERMSFSGRVRLSTLCKSWRRVSLRKEIATPPQLPWLVHPQSFHSQAMDTYLSFSSLSEGKVFKLRLPKPAYSKWRLSSDTPFFFYTSSKGWLILHKHYFNFTLQWQRIMFLVNPISGAQHQLPPLSTIPTYSFYDDKIYAFTLSSPDISQCMVAAIIDGHALALCTPRDTNWSCIQVLEEDDIIVNDVRICSLMFSSTGILYALVNDCLHGGVEADRTLMFGDHQVILRIVCVKKEWWSDDPGSDIMTPPDFFGSELLESANNELLLVHQIFRDVEEDNDENVMEGNENNDEANANVDDGAGNINNEGEVNDMENIGENESVLGWACRILFRARIKAMQLNPFFNGDGGDIIYRTTKCFRVYKFDPDNHNFYRVHNLEDQILFLGDGGPCLSLVASHFKELQGNCIYFAGRESDNQIRHISRDIGIFKL